LRLPIFKHDIDVFELKYGDIGLEYVVRVRIRVEAKPAKVAITTSRPKLKLPMRSDQPMAFAADAVEARITSFRGMPSTSILVRTEGKS